MVTLGEPSPVSIAFGYCGVVAALCVFLSPIPTCRHICKERSTSSNSLLPYLAQFVESSWWILWALAAGDRPEMLLNNVIGASFMVCYVSIFAIFPERNLRARIYGQMLGALMLVAAAVLVAICVEGPDTIIGMSAVMLNLLKYASLLSVACRVIRTQSTKCMPLPLTLALMACGLLWSAHGICLQDWYITAPNMAGLALVCVSRGRQETGQDEKCASVVAVPVADVKTSADQQSRSEENSVTCA